MKFLWSILLCALAMVAAIQAQGLNLNFGRGGVEGRGNYDSPYGQRGQDGYDQRGQGGYDQRGNGRGPPMGRGNGRGPPMGRGNGNGYVRGDGGQIGYI